jgi:hypothetical protein
VREDFVADWAFGATGAIEKTVRQNFPQDLRNWPLVQSFAAEGYELPSEYMALVIRDRLSGISHISGPKPFPYSDHPTLPPQTGDMEVWQFYLRQKFGLREEDAAFLIPIRDSGTHNPLADYALFTPEEQLFWHQQVGYVISRYNAHMQAIEGARPQQPSSVIYDVSGTNARVNISSTDSSVNVVRVDVAEVFNQLRGVLVNIENEKDREVISKSIDDMESAYGSPDFLSRYKGFVSLAAVHVAVFAPFLPALTNLLSQG